MYSYYEAFDSEKTDVVAEECKGASRGCTDCKAELAECMTELLAPIRERISETLSSGKVGDILAAGREKASAVASATLNEAMEAVGMR